jgi:hypothetical protein
MTSPLKVEPKFQLTLTNWPAFKLEIQSVLTYFGEAGRLLIQALLGQPYQLPQDIQLDDYLLAKRPNLLKALGLDTPSLRRTTLHAPPPPDVIVKGPVPDDIDDEFSKIFPEDNSTAGKSLSSQIPLKQRTALASDLDEYQNGITKILISIYSLTILSWITVDVMTAVKADSVYPQLLEYQDVFQLYACLSRVCLRIGSDKIADIEEEIEAFKQTSTMSFSTYKSKLDELFATYEIYNHGIPLEPSRKSRKILRGANPYKFEKQLKEYRMLSTPPSYEDICLELQLVEDANQWFDINTRRFDHEGEVKFKSRLVATGGATAILPAPMLLASDTSDSSPVVFCPECFKRTKARDGTGKQFPHKLRDCKHRNWQEVSVTPAGRVPPAIMRALIASYHANTVSEAEFEAEH